MTLVYPRIRSFARRSLGMRSGAHSYRVLDIDGREPLDLVPAECYLDELADAFHGADRNRRRVPRNQTDRGLRLRAGPRLGDPHGRIARRLTGLCAYRGDAEQLSGA